MSSPQNIVSDDSDYEPVEEEPIGDNHSEEDSEAESHPVSPIVPISSPTTQPERAPLFQPYRNFPNGPRMIRTPRKSVRMPNFVHLHDPYLPPPTARRLSDARRWDWVPRTLDTWRQQEGNPYPLVGESSSTAQADPVTGEPSHHTIALLVARTVRHETQLEQLEENLEALPPPEFYEELEQDSDYLGRGRRDLRRTTDELSTRVERNSRRLTEMERRMDNFEQKLEQLSTLADTSMHYASYIMGGHHVPK